jgi:hypothetical protein
MINLKYIFVFLSLFLLSQNIEAQQDSSTLIKNNPNATKAEPTPQDISKEIQALKEEIKNMKDPNTQQQQPVVIIRSSGSGSKSTFIRYTSIGMNMTTLISRLVPFGNGIPLSGPTSLMMRRYRDNRAFRMGLGLNANADAENINAVLRLGTERKKDLNDNFTFTRGVDFILGSGSFNTPGFRFTNTDGGLIGGLLSFGLDYKINKFVSVGTETFVFGGLGSGSSSGLVLKVMPPIALYLNMNLYQK